MKLKIIIAILFSTTCISVLNAQETISASGGEASGDGGVVSYTIGQVVYCSLIGTNGNSIVQGVQQPFIIKEDSTNTNMDEIKLEAKVYPNPATSFLILNVSDISANNYKVFMYDLNGKMLKNMELKETETTIEMYDLVPSLYFLKVVKNEKEVKVFKIIKK